MTQTVSSSWMGVFTIHAVVRVSTVFFTSTIRACCHGESAANSAAVHSHRATPASRKRYPAEIGPDSFILTNCAFTLLPCSRRYIMTFRRHRLESSSWTLVPILLASGLGFSQAVKEASTPLGDTLYALSHEISAHHRRGQTVPHQSESRGVNKPIV